MIEHIKIEKLNGKYDYDLNFNRDINIITGRNGAGKTTLMKLLWAAVSNNNTKFENEFSFQRATFNFFGSQKIYEITPHLSHNFLGLKTIFLPTFRRVEGGFYDWLNETWQQIRIADDRRKIKEGYKYDDSPKLIFSVGTSDIADLLKSKYAQISIQIQKIENETNQFTTNLIKTRNADSDNNDILQQIDKAIENTQLRKAELLKPLTILSELVAQFLNKKDKLSYEELIDIAQLGQLSSGEKQMLSFLSYCIFYENTIIFIDEPELSLHVDWQRLFIPTLIKLNTNNQYFLATHSPFIYSRYPDKEIILDENRGGE